jgi:hypothetical protein
LNYKYDLIDGRTLTMALSNKQSKRLGAIISVVFEEDLPRGSQEELVGNGFIEPNNKAIGYAYNLTDKGLDEKNRLCTLAGLNIKYKSEMKDAIQAKKKETKKD